MFGVTFTRWTSLIMPSVEYESFEVLQDPLGYSLRHGWSDPVLLARRAHSAHVQDPKYRAVAGAPIKFVIPSCGYQLLCSCSASLSDPGMEDTYEIVVKVRRFVQVDGCSTFALVGRDLTILN